MYDALFVCFLRGLWVKMKNKKTEFLKKSVV